MLREDCISCATLAGHRPVPGGIVYATPHWAFFLRHLPLLTPGQGFLVLKRHCEAIPDLTPAELQEIGPLLRQIVLAYAPVLHPQKVHFGLYGEGVAHMHWHVLPRTAQLPAGNIPVTLLGIGYEILRRLHLKQPYTDDQVARIAVHLRQELHRPDAGAG